MNEAMESKITIRIKCMASSMHEVSAKPQQTISELKTIIAKVSFLFSLSQQLNLTEAGLRLIFQGRLLKDTETLLHYKVFPTLI